MSIYTQRQKKRNWGTWVAFRRFSFILTFLSTFFGASQMQINFDVRIIFEKIRSGGLKTRSKWHFFAGARQARARRNATCKVDFFR